MDTFASDSNLNIKDKNIELRGKSCNLFQDFKKIIECLFYGYPKGCFGEMHWLFLLFDNSLQTSYDHSYQNIKKSYQYKILTASKSMKMFQRGMWPLVKYLFQQLVLKSETTEIWIFPVFQHQRFKWWHFPRVSLWLQIVVWPLLSPLAKWRQLRQ